MASEIEAAAERWESWRDSPNWRSVVLLVSDAVELADAYLARLDADRAEREERARHSLEVRCDGRGYDWLRDGEMVQARIGFNDPAVPALMLLGVTRKGGE